MTRFPAETERLSVPLGFDVPTHWVPADVGPDADPSLAAVLLRQRRSDDEFTATILVRLSHRPDAATVTDIADEAVGRLATEVETLAVAHRETVGPGAAPGHTQVLRLVAPGPLPLIHIQVHLALSHAPAGASGAAAGPNEGRLIAELTCVATPAQAERIHEEFEDFVAGFHVRQESA